MNIQELLKNPLVLGLIAAAGTYSYLYWDNMQQKKKYPKADIEPISMITPIIVGLLVFVIAYNLLKTDPLGQIPISNLPQQPGYIPELEPPKITGGIKNNIEALSASSTYHLVGKNAIRLPQADVFIDLAKF